MSYFWDWISRQSRLLVIALVPLIIVEYRTNQKLAVDIVTIAGFLLALWFSLPTRLANQGEVRGAVRRLRHTVLRNWTARRLVLVGDHDSAEVPYIHREDREDLSPGAASSWPGRGQQSDLFTHYRELRAGRLIITGSPGSGKSVAAYNLIIKILEYGLKAPIEDVVPIPLGVVGWDGERELTYWLIDRLVEGYRIVRPVAKRLVEQGYILPVFDGLDEVDEDPAAEESVAQKVLGQLNYSPHAILVAHGALIITCQSYFYDALFNRGSAVRNAVVIELQGLSPDAVRSYLRTRIRRAPQQRSLNVSHFEDRIARDDSCLIETLRRPVMLNLAIMALISGISTVGQLARYKRESALRDYLIQGILPAAVKATPKSPLPRIIGDSRKQALWWWRSPKTYTVEEVKRWLSCIAATKVGARRKLVIIRPDDLWQLAEANRVKHIHTALAMIMGLLVAGLAGEAIPGIAGVLVTAFTAVIGLGFAFWAGLPKRPLPRRLSLQQYATPAGLVRLLAVATLGGLCAVGGVYDGGIPTAITSGIGGTLAFAVLIGLTGNIVQIIDPKKILRNDFLFGSLFGLGVSIAAALPHGLTGGIAARLKLNDSLTVPGSATLAIVIAMVAGVILGSHVWTRYALMILMVAPSKRIPWRLMHFLKWCYAANLLRISGVAFELRHEEILKALD